MPETKGQPQAPLSNRAFSKATDWAKSLYDDFREFLSPSACLCCGRGRDFADPLLCPDCINKLISKNCGGGPICPFCGRPLGAKSSCELCHDPKPLDLYYWGFYDQELKECLLQFKFRGSIDLGKRLSEMAVSALAERLTENKYDYIIPIPLHKARQRERHYNQSEIIAECLSQRLEFKLLSEGLERVRATHQQAKLAEQDRWNNVKNAFVIPDSCREILKGKSILLVDDIVTTGATIFEATRPLLDAQVKRLDIFSIAYAK